jgi:Flp pilus assembly protein TadG
MTPFRSDRRGLAALEFGLIAPVLLVILGGIADLGLATVGRSQLANGLAQGVQLALATGPGISAASLRSFVQSGAARAGLTEPVTVTVSGPACYCVSGSPAAIGTGSPLSVTNTCTGICAAPASGPGTFVVITATYTYQPIMPLYGMVTGTTVSQTATARLL